MLLAPQSVVRYLVARGQLHASDAATVEELGGGVSCVVLGVESASGRRLVAKQARPRLQVADEWMAPVGRVVNEAAALWIMARILPGTVPLVLDVDREANLITIECAPRDWRSWKQDLMDGVVESATARFLGKALGRLHSCSLDDEAVRRAFADRDVFTRSESTRTTEPRRPVGQRWPPRSRRASTGSTRIGGASSTVTLRPRTSWWGRRDAGLSIWRSHTSGVRCSTPRSWSTICC